MQLTGFRSATRVLDAATSAPGRRSSSAPTRPARPTSRGASSCSPGALRTAPTHDAELIALGRPTSPDSRPTSSMAGPRAGRASRSSLARSGPAGARKRRPRQRRAAAAAALAAGPAGRPLRARGHAARRRLAVAPPAARSTRCRGAALPAAAATMATYARALSQRNNLLRPIREGAAGPDELRYWDAVVIEDGGADRRLAARRRWPPWPRRWPHAHAEIAPAEPTLELRYLTNAAADRDESAVGRPAPAPGRDGREGAVERRHAGRAAPRRHRLRARRPRPGGLRLARPAAHGDPGVQARRARPA